MQTPRESMEREKEIETQTSVKQRQPDQSVISGRMDGTQEEMVTYELH